MPMPLAELHNREADHAALLALFKEMEFKTWVDESTALLNSAPSFELTVSSSDIPDEQIQPVVSDMRPQASVEKDYQPHRSRACPVGRKNQNRNLSCRRHRDHQLGLHAR